MNENQVAENIVPSVATASVVDEESGDAFPSEVETYQALLIEAEALRSIYPDFDLAAELAHPVLGCLLRGEEKPSLRQLYEAAHLDDIVTRRIGETVENAVRERIGQAVAEAVRRSEEQLLSHIRARGQRPAENGIHAATGIRMHPAVGRLTRRERAMLAKRAENGETITL